MQKVRNKHLLKDFLFGKLFQNLNYSKIYIHDWNFEEHVFIFCN